MLSFKKQNLKFSGIGIIVAIILFGTSGTKLPVLDSSADSYFDAAITKAGVAYATCRAINASVSIVKESNLQLEPAGVGVSLAVGQALDPIDDMTERLSDVLVTAITSLGIQKLVYAISVTVVPRILACCLLLLSVVILIENNRMTRLQMLLARGMLFLVIARFCLPVSSVANTLIEKSYFSDQIAQANSELALGFAELDTLKDFSLPEIDGVLGTIENSSAFLKKKSTEFKDALIFSISNTGKIIDNLLQLMFLYVGIFLLQVILLPLLVFWVFVKTGNALFPIEINLSTLPRA
jgi:hypothetical protein